MRKWCAALPLVLISQPGWAQDEIVLADPLRDDLIVVVATGSRQWVELSGQPMSVVGEGELRDQQGPDLKRVIERLPGVTVARNGGLGGVSTVHLRGGEGDETLVLIDGVPVNDPASPGGAYDFGALTTGGIGKIEVLRGSNSVIWGSQAMAGVVALSSAERTGIAGSAETGSRQTIDLNLAAGLAGDAYAVTIDGGRTRSDGFSAAEGGSEADGFAQWRLGGRGRLALTERLSLVANARHSSSRSEIDGYPAPLYLFADTAEAQRTRQDSGRAGVRWQADDLSLDAGYAMAETRRRYFDEAASPAFQYGYTGKLRRADASGRWDRDSWSLDFGATDERTRFASTFDAPARARLTSGHALAGWHGGRASVSFGGRWDDHSRFGGHASLGGDASVRLGSGWRLRGAIGQGFKAPSLFQLSSSYGNDTLKPERSTSFDAGLELSDRNASVHAAVSLFRRDSRDLIQFVSCASVGLCASRPFGTYGNVGRARAEGWEVEGGFDLFSSLSLSGVWSRVKASDRASGLDLAHRPRNAVSGTVKWRAPYEAVIGLDVRWVSHSFDDNFEGTRLPGYTTLTFRAAVPLTERVELFGRVENLTDADDRSVAGYGVAGRSGFIGVRTRL